MIAILVDCVLVIVVARVHSKGDLFILLSIYDIVISSPSDLISQRATYTTNE